MFWKIVAGTALVVFAFAILFSSILRSASIKYSFSLPPEETSGTLPTEESVSYELAYPGKILPDSPLWFLKVLRDKLWITLTLNPTRKTELNLLFADKRLVASQILFQKENYELGASILLKGEMYLKEASLFEEHSRRKGIDTTEFLKRLTAAALKHRQIIDGLIAVAPEDARPEIVKVKDITRDVFVRGRNALQEVGEPAPKSPSEWD